MAEGKIKIEIEIKRMSVRRHRLKGMRNRRKDDR